MAAPISTNKTQLQTNNTNLSSLIEVLRGKAVGGGSSSSGETTCSLTVTANADADTIVYAGRNDNESEVTNYVSKGTTETFVNIPLGSLIIIRPQFSNPQRTVSGLDIIENFYDAYEKLVFLYQITSSDASIIISDESEEPEPI